MLAKKKKGEDINYLELTPNRLYEHELNEKGLIDVLVPRFTDKVFGKLLQPRLRNKYIKANLDALGSAAWELIDGKNNVDAIAATLRARFGEEIEPVYDRLTAFLTQLYKNGFINFKEL
ncbi:MAG: PqqD family protein [Chloroflexota bacterium]